TPRGRQPAESGGMCRAGPHLTHVPTESHPEPPRRPSPARPALLDYAHFIPFSANLHELIRLLEMSHDRGRTRRTQRRRFSGSIGLTSQPVTPCRCWGSNSLGCLHERTRTGRNRWVGRARTAATRARPARLGISRSVNKRSAGHSRKTWSATSPSATETALTSMSLSCSATQRRTDALSSAWTIVLLMGPWSLVLGRTCRPRTPWRLVRAP